MTAGRVDTERALRVLMVTPRFPPDVGGVERHVHEVSRRLAAMGCTVGVLCTDRSASATVSDTVDGVSVSRIPAWPRRADYYFAPSMWQEIRADEWDVIHVQSYHTLVAPLAMLRAIRLRVPFVLTFHGGGHSSGFRRAIRSVQQAALGPLVRRASRLVAVARFEVSLYGRACRVPADRFVFIPNGSSSVVDAALPDPPQPDAPVIATIGRLERYKGHHRVVAAFPEVVRRLPGATLWIVGVGPYESQLREQVEALGIAQQVEFRSTPSDRPEAMAALMRATSIVVCLSDFESHPIVAVEAAAAGRPLLVSATSGLQELADDGWARAVPLDSGPVAVAEAILRGLYDPLVPPSAALPTWDDCAGRLLELYRETCAGGLPVPPQRDARR